MWLAWPLAAEAACTFRATSEDLDAALAAAEAAYASLDAAAFERANNELDFVVPCLAAALDPAAAARLHRLRGLGRFADGDREGALDALRAARQIDPSYGFPEELLPRGFELRDAYDAFPADPAPTDRLPRPARGTALRFDGVEGRDRPERPTLLQRVDVGDDGVAEVVATVWLAPDEDAPPYPGANRRRAAWLAGAAVTAVAGGGALGAAGAVGAPVRRGDPLAPDDVAARQSAANGLTTAGWALFAAGAAELGVGLAARRPR